MYLCIKWFLKGWYVKIQYQVTFTASHYVHSNKDVVSLYPSQINAYWSPIDLHVDYLDNGDSDCIGKNCWYHHTPSATCSFCFAPQVCWVVGNRETCVAGSVASCHLSPGCVGRMCKKMLGLEWTAHARKNVLI